ncbi:LuxR C-terminal-related transcriptional regulator [Marinobacter salexigens]|uniref:LuxR C-terminal-related transcriptional regulator n=1 Tax=Marinobacter salexigens TaxID=1925763 RepID=A0ABS6AAG8_9GAMM|nr:LuxR C-terminal-related transcriptional regulator [Marinobacter salexigens]MBU2874675.1 LuxR C-terminal-related transcriptional regulator [Marinobacter salexigens]
MTNVPVFDGKLQPPCFLSTEIKRKRLIDQYRQLGGSAVALICAPAGYGKTVSMIQYCRQFEGRSLWLSLDAKDNDPTRLVEHLAEALARAEMVSDTKDKSNKVGLNNEADSEAVLSRLLNLIQRYKRPVLLALDDCHFIKSPQAIRVIEQILKHAPANVKFLMGSRRQPLFATAKLRASGRVFDITEEELAFRAEEAVSMFKMSGVNISSEDVYELNNILEGWPTGIQLWSVAYLEMRRRNDSFPDIKRVRALAEQYLDDYFYEEVMVKLPVSAQQFMLHMSVVESFGIELAQLLSKLPAQSVPIKRLIRENCFLQVKSSTKGWYRFHPILQQALYRRYSRTALTEAQFLHHRAADWFHKHEHYAEALHQYGRSRDVEAFLNILKKHTFDLIREGDVSDLVKGLDNLPDDLGDDFFAVTVMESAVVHVIHDVDRIQICMDRLKRLIESPPAYASRERLYQTRAYLAAHLAHLRGNFCEGIRLADDVLHEGRPDNAATAVMRHHRADCYLALGILPQAREDAEQALAELKQFGLVGYTNTPAYILGQIDLAKGNLELAEQRFLGLKPSETSPSASYNFYDIFYFLGLGALRTVQNRLEEAEKLLETALAIAQKYPPTAALPWVLHRIALVCCARNDIEIAARTWDDARTIADKYELNGIYRLCSSHRARLGLRKATDDPAVRTWELEWDGIHGQMGVNTLPEERLTYGWLQMRAGGWRESFRTCKRLISECGAQSNRVLLIEAHILLAALYRDRDRIDRAITAIDDAVRLAAEYDLLTLFHQEGRDLLELFREGVTSSQPDERGVALLTYREFVESLLVAPSGHYASNVKPGGASIEGLTKRELDVLRLIADGRSNHEIAGSLFVGVSTVKTHINSIFKKLNVTTREEAIDMAVSQHLLGSGKI